MAKAHGTQSSYGIIIWSFIVQAWLYGVWMSVSHPSLLESLSKFTHLLIGMGNGFTENAKL
jgi:hypothetical protein